MLLLLILSLALVTLCCLASANAELNASAVPLVEIPIGKHHVDNNLWQAFLRENLHADIAPWRRRAPLKAANILLAYNQTMRTMYVPAVVQLVLIYNNRIYWVNRPDPNGGDPERRWSSNFNIHFHRRLVPALASGKLRLPNVLFIYNTDDNAPRFNAPKRNLPVPMLSLIKSLGLKDGDDMDILVPQFYLMQTSMYVAPWHLKVDRAFFRGIGFCSDQWKVRYRVPDACSRLYLSQLTYIEEQHGNSTALDCGLVEELRHYSSAANRSITIRLPVKPRVPFKQHAAYKWVLHLEGITASSRLGQLMLTNSLVLLQRSYWYEYFYRSLRPWVHYVPFWNATSPDGQPLGMDDVYSALAELRRLDREQPEVVQQIIATANTFAIKFLNTYGRMRYFQAAVTEYKSLFPDMDAFLKTYVADLRSKGWIIP